MTQRPIRDRLILVGVVVITAIIGATGLIVEMQRQASIDAFGTATTNLANGMAQQTAASLASIDRALVEIQTGLASAPNEPPADITLAMRQKSTFDVLVDQRKRLSGVNALFLVAADGMVTNSASGWPAAPAPAARADVSATDFFTHFSSAEDHAVFVSAPAKDPASGEWTTFITRRVDDTQGRFAGLVVARISLTVLQRFFQVAMPASRSVYILRSDGIVLVRYPPRDQEIGRKIPDRSPWYATVAGGGGKYRGIGYFDRTSIIAVVQPLRNLPLVVEASVTEADTLAEWYQQRVWVVLGGVSSIICVIILLRLFGAQYRRVELSERSLAKRNAELATALGQLDATLANISQGVCFYDEDNRLVVCNRRYSEGYNLPDAAIRPGISLTEISRLRVAAGTFSSRSIEEHTAFINGIVRAGKPHSMVNVLTNGRSIAGHLQPLPGRGWVVTNEDITERCEAEAKVAFLARHDVLTGLANRSLFQERLNQALSLAGRGKGFALLCLDLDGFKLVNDTYGHPIGDSLLRAVAVRLLEAMRKGDTVARLGGDEFAILQVDVSEADETAVVAQRIVQSISEPFELDGHKVRVGTSIGIALAPANGLHSEQLMQAADLALYRAKQEGRGTWRFFEPAMDAAAQTRRALEVDLRSALPLGQLELYYQPLVWSGDRSLTGFEALLRWHHPTRGLVPPGDFISVTEKSGLIAEIGAWVLQQACAEAMTWPDDIRVAVNLSTGQFRGHDLVGTVADAIRTSGLPPERLELEITETVPLQESQATLAILHDLRALGPRIALDDFGTGYSSLSYLRGFPFDTIKIDRSFVSDLQVRDNGIALIRGITGLAAKLQMNVTAEGVETEAQFELLARAGCTEIQGFLISKPVPAHEVPALIEILSGRRLPAAPSSHEVLKIPGSDLDTVVQKQAKFNTV